MANLSGETMNATEPRTLELIGGSLGLAAALALGTLRVVNEAPPQRLEEALGNVVFGLILLTPYVLALLSARLPVRFRWVILLPCVLLSLVSLGISLAGVGFIFLPAMVLLAIATVRSLERTPSMKVSRKGVIVLASILVVAIVGTAFFTLLLSHDDPRTWEYTTYADGRTVWNSVTPTQGISTIGPLQPGAVEVGSESVSDVITNKEAVESLGLLVIAGVGFYLLSRYAKRHSDDQLSV